jgi:hypothetical protein
MSKLRLQKHENTSRMLLFLLLRPTKGELGARIREKKIFTQSTVQYYCSIWLLLLLYEVLLFASLSDPTQRHFMLRGFFLFRSEDVDVHLLSLYIYIVPHTFSPIQPQQEFLRGGTNLRLLHSTLCLMLNMANTVPQDFSIEM